MAEGWLQRLNAVCVWLRIVAIGGRISGWGRTFTGRADLTPYPLS